MFKSIFILILAILLAVLANGLWFDFQNNYYVSEEVVIEQPSETVLSAVEQVCGINPGNNEIASANALRLVEYKDHAWLMQVDEFSGIFTEMYVVSVTLNGRTEEVRIMGSPVGPQPTLDGLPGDAALVQEFFHAAMKKIPPIHYIVADGTQGGIDTSGPVNATIHCRSDYEANWVIN